MEEANIPTGDLNFFSDEYVDNDISTIDEIIADLQDVGGETRRSEQAE